MSIPQKNLSRKAKKITGFEIALYLSFSPAVVGMWFIFIESFYSSNFDWSITSNSFLYFIMAASASLLFLSFLVRDIKRHRQYKQQKLPNEDDFIMNSRQFIKNLPIAETLAVIAAIIFIARVLGDGASLLEQFSTVREHGDVSGFSVVLMLALIGTLYQPLVLLGLAKILILIEEKNNNAQD